MTERIKDPDLDTVIRVLTDAVERGDDVGEDEACAAIGAAVLLQVARELKARRGDR